MRDTIHNTIRILIVDDEPDMRTILRRCFETAGYGVCEAGNGAEAWARLAERSYDLVTVDVKLFAPDGNGREDGSDLARQIHERHDCAIIMVSVINNMEERNSWLEDWADDTITKPFVVEELLARTRAVLRRAGRIQGRETANGGQTGDIATFAEWTLDFKRHELRSPEGTAVALTMGDFNLLRNLFKHPQEVLSRDQIVEMDSSIQSMSSSDSARAVDMRISRLRSKLGDHDQKLIRTVRAAGYMFVADVVWRTRDSGKGPGLATGPAIRRIGGVSAGHEAPQTTVLSRDAS